MNTFISEESKKVIPMLEKVIQAANHRPFNPTSEAHQKFIAKTLVQIKSLEKVVFGGFEEEKSQLHKL